ncbi:unnamed protein product [Laminaria digitata]
MKVLAILLSWLGVTSAFLLSQAPGRGLTSHDHLSAAASSTSTTTPSGEDLVQFRAALPEELGAIRGVLAGMLMNPMSVDVQNFICAEEEGLLVGFGQVRAIGGSEFELASLHVNESHRRRGIGSSLVRQLVDEFVETHGPGQLEKLYLLTLKDAAIFYEKLGFNVVSPEEAPAVLKAERAVGSFIQSFFGNSLVCMRATSG